MRDPALVRSPNGDRYWIIATDLCIGCGQSWADSTGNGSRNLVVWEPGLADSGWTSFQSYNYPTRYIRHYAYLLRLDPISDAQGRSDATFRVTN